MHRRNMLKGMAAVIALQSDLLSQLAANAAATSAFSRVRPGDAAWPSAASWAKLNEAVGGNLIAAPSPFGACATDAGSAPCVDALANIRNPFYLGDQPGGTQVSGWLDAWTPAPSAYAVKARSSGDVAAAVNFARDNNLRLVVKGAGHSYQGTSNAPDSLLIWTRAMDKVTLHDSFAPQGCEGKIAPGPAVSAEAGAVWIDLYHAVTSEAGRYVQGGGCTDVGVAGLIQSGGFGSFSKGFGSAAAGLLEAEIVTADGAVRIANACTNPDLFWAIKGGGGGSWGVVTRVTLRTHDLPAFLGGAWGTIKAQSDDAFRRLIARFLAFYAESLFNPHWGEQIGLGSDNILKLSMVCQGLDTPQASAVWQPFFDWVKASPEDFDLSASHGAGALPARHFWDVAGSHFMIADSRAGVPAFHGWWRGDQDQVGMFLHGYESLWLPASLLREAERQRFADALFAASRIKKVDLHFNKGLAGAPDEAIAAARDTATNPAMTEAFALAIIADGEGPRYPGLARPALDVATARKHARAIDLAALELRRVAPDAGSYVSESNYFVASWQDAFWGSNYPRLRAVKAKYDPGGLFFVRHGVGSEGWSDDGFTRG
ncbi:FAD-binding oxidoreductase [Methylocapsa sp. S129]|uniref:FAD-dependent oxidoreductase n=1 Tax=Methylocapsa sp. S129 TaxID=1641869 RepID=UPI00131AA9A8|nr:FAD-binding oxidoreductase [Methylocapsa sp. S129]